MVFSDVVAVDKYCRWDDALGRRETWGEAVTRLMNYYASRGFFDRVDPGIVKKLHGYLENREIFGSMRALMTAGQALDADDIASYNCSYIAVKSTTDFMIHMYLLSRGTGSGFSVEREFTRQLPDVPKWFTYGTRTIIVPDSASGWAESLREFVDNLYDGVVSIVDLSLIRPRGARLKTFGGTASGPEPYRKMLDEVTNVFTKRQYDTPKLQPIEVHDIMCSIASCIVSGGVRRSACISLSDLDDMDMRNAKNTPEWYFVHPNRAMSNNSVAYNTKPDLSEFRDEMNAMWLGNSGERGIFNRQAVQSVARGTGRDPDHKYGTNPCSETILRDRGLCNLSTCVVKAHDTEETIAEKLAYAAILGTIQSALTNFTFFQKHGIDEFAKNCEDERLLVVSMTGIYDNPLTNGGLGAEKLAKFLSTSLELIREVNSYFAWAYGINPSKALTGIKPEGTTSCVAGSSSGLHPSFAPFYIRRMVFGKDQAMTRFLIDSGVLHDEVGDKIIFKFPMKAPGQVTRHDISAIGHLNLWKMYQMFYCEHKPSVTVYYKNEEFPQVVDWIWDNWDIMTGISLLPFSDHVYDNPPFEEITQEKYDEMTLATPSSIDWDRFSDYESVDTSTGYREFACTGDGCEVR